jgi:uncharacterized protein
MKITFDPAKRASTLRDRSLDFADAAEVFAGKALNIPDERRDYGEPRIITVGSLRGDGRHVFSMRKANDREKARFGKRLEES